MVILVNCSLCLICTPYISIIRVQIKSGTAKRGYELNMVIQTAGEICFSAIFNLVDVSFCVCQWAT
jgi:hypothetical protein